MSSRRFPARPMRYQVADTEKPSVFPPQRWDYWHGSATSFQESAPAALLTCVQQPPFIATMEEWLWTNVRSSRRNRKRTTGKYQCPKCRRTGEYSIRWVRRSRKDRLPAGADDGDRAKFAKLRDYLLRLDDEVTCKTCGRKFEVPSQHSLIFVDQLAGLPDEEASSGRSALRRASPSPHPRIEAGASSPVHPQVGRLEVAGDAAVNALRATASAPSKSAPRNLRARGIVPCVPTSHQHLVQVILIISSATRRRVRRPARR